MCDTLQLNWKLPSASNSSNSNSNGSSSSSDKKSKRAADKKSAEGKYTLRACSIQKRLETETRKTQPKKRGPKPRPKSQPMSKYRRKTANLRERERMGEINIAFEKLRDKIPTPAISGKGRCEKMTKINILHVAITYIRALENILDTGEAGVNEFGTAVVQSPGGGAPLGFEASASSSDDPMALTRPMLAVSAKVKKVAKKICARKVRYDKIRKRPLIEQQPGCLEDPKGSPVHSGSEDSGIHEEDDDDDDDEMEDEEEDEEEEEEELSSAEHVLQKDCPDWTELVSTLEFPPSIDSSPSSVSSSSSTSSNVYIPNGSSGDIAASLKALTPLFPPPAAAKRTDLDTLLTSTTIGSKAAARPAAPAALPGLSRQLSFPELDLFGDLDTTQLAESFEGLGDLNFAHEDPFQELMC